MKQCLLLCFIYLLLNFNCNAQNGAFGYSLLNDKQREVVAPQYLTNTPEHKVFIAKEGWKITHENSNFIHFSAPSIALHEAFLDGEISNYFIEYAPATVLNDSMRKNHEVDKVHAGLQLSQPFFGKDVIVGFVDTGIDLEHPDFKDINGNTRILRVWDQSTGASTGNPYGYGTICDSAKINAGTCTQSDQTAHGTTVAGAASGNGFSTGNHIGVAPQSDIIMVKTSFSIPNWTNTVADACDYIFKVADSLGKPAVVNLSVGTYLGSHDGTDPAAVRIDNLLTEKTGRLVVAACGNSGNFGNYHCQSTVENDTSFVWFKNNPSNAIGPNKIFFDLYSTASDANYNFTLNATNPNTFSKRAQLMYRGSMSNLGSPINDTLRNDAGEQLAIVQIYSMMEGSNLHMQVLFSTVDSLDYYYGFEIAGTGKYDLWSGATLGYNEMVQVLPNSTQYPGIEKYAMPDAHQTIVSSWNCSPKVVSVGNLKNRLGYMTIDGIGYNSTDTIHVGQLSVNSSKGPSRHNVLKPNVAASGDIMVAPAPMWYLQDTNNVSRIEAQGWHMGNGGTSMASPVVAGIGALYLERCERGNFQEFIQLLFSSSQPNAYSGTLPNNAYGAGVVNAHRLMYIQDNYANSTGDMTSCYSILNSPQQKIKVAQLFPNPATDMVTIQSIYPIKQLMMFDIAGKEIEIEKIGNSLSLTKLEKGMYIIQISNEMGTEIHYLIKK